MLYKILEKYSKLKTDHESILQKENDKIMTQEQEVLKHFLILYDNDVKKIHSNQVLIEKDLQSLYSDTKALNDICKQGLVIYDGLVEYFKEAGDLYNWSTIIEKEMNSIHEQIIGHSHKTEVKESQVEENKK